MSYTQRLRLTSGNTKLRKRVHARDTVQQTRLTWSAVAAWALTVAVILGAMAPARASTANSQITDDFATAIGAAEQPKESPNNAVELPTATDRHAHFTSETGELDLSLPATGEILDRSTSRVTLEGSQDATVIGAQSTADA